MPLETVVVSNDYRLRIPKSVRESLGIKPGTPYHVIEAFGRIEFIPIGDTKSLRGFVRGIDTTVDPDDQN